MTRLYELEQAQNPDVDASAGEVTASAAVSALSNRLRHRLELIAFCTGGLEELGWEVELVDDVLIATARTTPYDARHALEDAGVAGPLCAVSELDDSGWPRLWYGGDA